MFGQKEKKRLTLISILKLISGCARISDREEEAYGKENRA